MIKWFVYNRRLELLLEGLKTYADNNGWELEAIENGCILEKFPILKYVELKKDYSVKMVTKSPYGEHVTEYKNVIVFMDDLSLE